MHIHQIGCVSKNGGEFTNMYENPSNQRFKLGNNSFQIGFITAVPMGWRTCPTKWGINPCSVLPHGMCLRRLSITRTTLVETLRLLEVVELLVRWVRWVWAPNKGSCWLIVKKRAGGSCCTMTCHNGACVSPSYWFFECYHLISMNIHEGEGLQSPSVPPTSICCWAIPQFWWTATRALLWFQCLEDFNPMTEDVEVRIAPLGKHVPSREKNTQHVPRKRNLPTRCSYSGVPVFFCVCMCQLWENSRGQKFFPHWGCTLRSFGQ